MLNDSRSPLIPLPLLECLAQWTELSDRVARDALEDEAMSEKNGVAEDVAAGAAPAEAPTRGSSCSLATSTIHGAQAAA